MSKPCERTGKVKYATKPTALSHATRYARFTPRAVRVYLCEFCGLWHLTTQAKRGRQAG